MTHPPQPDPAGPPPYQPAWALPAPPDGEKAKKNKDTRNGCGCMLLLAAAIGIGFASCGGNSTSTSPSSDTNPVAAAPADPATADPATTDPAPAPSHNAAYTTAARIIAWDQNGGLARLTALSNDFTQLSADANNNQGAVAADCQQISADTAKAAAYQHVPDAAAQKHWAAALADFRHGAADCTAGVNSSDTAQMTKGSNEISAGDTQVLAVARRFTAITNAMK